MRYQKLGHTDITVSVLALGTMTFGEQNSQSEAHEQLDLAFDHGVNFIDTAESYPAPPAASTQGDAERCVGTWLRQRGRRDDVIIATKASGPAAHLAHIRGGRTTFAPAELMEALDDSLRRLQTDYVDLYQLHWPQRPTNTFGQRGYKPAQRDTYESLEPTLRALESLVASGKVRAIGISNETPWGLMSFLSLAARYDLPRVAAIQNPYNLLNRTIEIGLAEIVDRENVGFVAYSPLAFGRLTGKYAGGATPPDTRLTRYDRFVRYNKSSGVEASERYVQLAHEFDLHPVHMAIAFILSRRYVTSVIIGATTREQLLQNFAGVDIEITKPLLKAIDKIHQQIPDPCP